MQWKIEPRNAVGFLRFGMSLDAVVELLGKDYKQFRRSPSATELVTAFDSKGLHLVFDEEGLKQITVFEPNEANLGTIQLLGQPMDAIHEELTRSGFVFESVDAGLWCKQSGVLLVDVDGRVDGVEVIHSP